MSASRRERGLTIVIIALTLVVMLVFAAFAIDLGAVYNHRRQDQNAADAGALAAVQEIGGSESAIVLAAQDYTEATLGVDLPDADWDTCAGDPGALSVQATGSNCVSYNASQVRVRVPDQIYDTYFGGVVGVDTFTHAAFAIAALRREGFGGVLPYAVTGASANGGFGCLQSNSNGQASPWCGSSSGNFGFLDFSQYGNFDLGTSHSCGSGDTNLRVRNNTAMGTDHDLSSDAAPVYSTDVIDTDECPDLTPSPNAAWTQTGNQSSDVTDGLFDYESTYPDGGPARLQRSNDSLFGGNGQTTSVLGVNNLDNNPLWQFIPANYGPGMSTTANIPNSCRRNQFVDSSNGYTTANITPDSTRTFIEAEPDERDRVLGLLVRCVLHYMGQDWNGFPIGSLDPPEPSTGCTGACSDPVFSRNSSTSDTPDLFDIQYTPRFGYVPQISDFPSGASQARRLLRFRPVFMHRLLIENGPHIWDPGVSPAPPTTGGYTRVAETSVFVFPDGILPGDLGDPGAPFQIGVNRFVRLIR